MLGSSPDTQAAVAVVDQLPLTHCLLTPDRLLGLYPVLHVYVQNCAGHTTLHTSVRILGCKLDAQCQNARALKLVKV